ncbi:hypothetical protein DVA67_032945 [Solirubrobacter sp. CPCC 204708]|uniref:Delta-60 repeat domain-containing protein n=1 Tax=Solirubrobacter deserti TaxID=2282478 RepID=A0ABT4RIZ6_9ACTN|nr:hypothetical protein [Solirubrobacter deserti]MBE2320813.1 hypothetical protein [Solirubrobacter deserti]MDA0138448.1 hypothetical protein [Solirubrobacter deserti]
MRRSPLAAPAYFFERTAGRFGLVQNRLAGTRQVQVLPAGAAAGVTITVDMVAGGIDAFGVDGRGRIVVAGSRAGQAGVTLWRFERDGRPDLGYGGDGTVEVPELRAAWEMIVERDGRVYAIEPRRLVGLDASGKPLPGFTRTGLPWPAGHYDERWIDGFARGRDGTFTILGSDSGYELPFVARLRPNGRLDRRFAARGFFARHRTFKSEIEFSAVTVDRRGRVLFGGSVFADGYVAALYRLTARGRLDRTFARRGIKEFRLGRPAGIDIGRSTIGHIAVDRRGRIVVAGNVYDEDFEYREDIGNPYPAIARLHG